MIDVYDIALAGLLHDIGKVMQRAEVAIDKGRFGMRCPERDGRPTHQHVMWTEQFFFPHAENQAYWQEIANLASSHHNASAFKNATDAEYWLIQCLIQADRISSSWDRGPDEEDASQGAYKAKQLHSIFGDVFLGGRISEKCALNISPKETVNRSAFPIAEDAKTPKIKDYAEVYRLFRADYETLLMAIDRGVITKPNLIDAIDSLMEKYFWSIPSNTMEARPTNSLYYHSRITSGIASALYSYYSAKAESRTDLNNLIDSENRVLMLVGGDLSGIQDYIYDLHPEHSRYAAKTLRARSFKIKTLCDIVLQRICFELQLPRQCVLMNAGGKFMLIVPNLPEVEACLATIRHETEQEFYREFLGTVSLNMDWHTGIRFRDLKMENFPSTLDAFIENLEQAKFRKFSTCLQEGSKWNTAVFTLEQPRYYSTLCPQCGKRTVESREGGASEPCEPCQREIKLGEILPKKSHFVIGKGQPTQDVYVPMFGEWYLEPYAPGARLREDMFAFCIRETGDNKQIPYPYKPVASSLPVYDGLTQEQQELLSREDSDQVWGDTLTFDELANLALSKAESGKYLGVPFNAVLKGDVDNLGNIFSLGLRYDSQGRKKAAGFSVTQYATMSAAVDWFFSAYLPALVDSEPAFANKVYTVYAGGDDFCLIGPWDAMLELAMRLDKEFRAYCGDHPDLHFSAALTLMHGKAPIRFTVEKADEDLDKAKKHGETATTPAAKNALRLFDTTVPWDKMEAVMRWDTLFNQWLEDANTGQAKGFSTQFLYRLMQYSDMALRYQDKKEIRDLLYKSYLTYDLKRNFKENSEPVEKLQELAWQDEMIRMLRVPLHKTIYKNRKYH